LIIVSSHFILRIVPYCKTNLCVHGVFTAEIEHELYGIDIYLLLVGC